MSGTFSRALHAVPDPGAPCAAPQSGPVEAPVTDAEVIAAQQVEITGLRQAMASRAAIEQAKGMIMMCYGVADGPAFSLLVRWSSSWNIKIRDLAAILVAVGIGVPRQGVVSLLEQDLATAMVGLSRPGHAPSSPPPEGA